MLSSSFATTGSTLVLDFKDASISSLFYSEEDLEPLPLHEESGWPTNDRILFDFEPTPIRCTSTAVETVPAGAPFIPLMNCSKEDSSNSFGSMYNPLSMALIMNNLVKANSSKEETPGPNNNDVVCSRGRRFHDLPGCVRFRKIVNDYIPSYVSASSRVDKSSVIAQIIDEVLNHDDGPVRFLKYQASTKSWNVMGKEQIRDKVGHALREVIEEMNRNERLAAWR
ncbi:hypothetical protein FisN_37Hh034 [Fistulifera solaris]|uniref:DUF6824 domain-containing protein n=1 Tax=Fistulifera solaris TaxID=1519565 RepID=A0A1Z5KJI1_FISSO|nr:hypothetical protein FisN_37Hh034 [Fistulifera solaris]|eukprot:GAX26416.1 hypothetical protein FisN_37Hh034 [Fistulifera solaris]